MTISNTVCKVSYPGDGAKVTFDFNFLIPEGAIRVYLCEGEVSTLVDPSEYGVTGFDEKSGGSVTFGTAPTATQTVLIKRYLEPTQTRKLLPVMTGYVNAVEGVLDRLTMLVQQLCGDMSRVLMVPEGSTQTPEEVLEDLNKGRDGTPVGQVAAYAMATAPTGWLECNGAAVSRETYADLYAAIGNTYGSGDGSSTFNLPDLRGEFIRGFDNGRGVDAGRAIGGGQAQDINNHGHTFRLSYDNNPTGGYNGAFTGSISTSQKTVGPFVGNPSETEGQQIGGSGGSETRPRNVAMMYCIKADL